MRLEATEHVVIIRRGEFVVEGESGGRPRVSVEGGGDDVGGAGLRIDDRLGDGDE